MVCGLLQVNRLLGKKWTIFILQEIHFNKILSFNKLNNKLKKTTNRVLSNRLQELENYGIVKRIVKKRKPLSVEYSLSDKGNELARTLNATKNWGVKYKVTPKNCLDSNCNTCLQN